MFGASDAFMRIGTYDTLFETFLKSVGLKLKLLFETELINICFYFTVRSSNIYIGANVLKGHIFPNPSE